MKKIFTFLTLATFALVASATTCKFTADDGSHVDRIEYNGTTYKFEAGSNTLEFEATVGAQATIYLASPWLLDPSSYYTYKNADGVESAPSGFWADYRESCQRYIGEYNQSYDFYINTIDLEAQRTNSFTVNVHGDPSLVSVSLGQTYYTPTLVEGENTVKFADFESPIAVRCSDYTRSLYEVYLNDVKQEAEYGSWNVAVANGSVVDVYTDFPDKDVTVTISFLNDAAATDFTLFQINGEDIVYESEPLKAKMGQTLSLVVNLNEKNLNSFEVNGEEVELPSYYPSYSTTLMEDLNIVLDMSNKPLWKANVTVDNCANIMYTMTQTSFITPETNEFVIEFPEPAYGSQIVSFAATASGMITSMKLEGEEITVNPRTGYYDVYFTADGQKLEITTSTIVRDEAFVFYFDSPEKAQDVDLGLYGWRLSCAFASRTQEFNENITAGYNAIYMCEADYPFNFEVKGEIKGVVDTYVFAYYNNTEWPLDTENYQTSWSFSPNDKDVFKVYIAEKAPERYQVSFSLSDPTLVEYAVVDLCHEFAVDNTTPLVEQLPGTEIGLEVVEGAVVKVNDVVVDPVEDNVYLLTVYSDMKVDISKESGIDSVTVSEDSDAPVYNLMGVKVSNGSTDALPAGLYIKKGVKVLVK